MRALVQRVSRGRVTVDSKTVGEIGRGLVILLGVGQDDTEADAHGLADKCLHLRIFEDEAGKMNRSVKEAGGEILAVSQFTLYGDCRRGRRPSFTGAAPPEQAEALYRTFVRALADSGLRVETGTFAARMEVEIVNDGPVTLMVETPSVEKKEIRKPEC